jgi:thimet oligopeptidase
MALWAQMEGATPLGHVGGSLFPAGFEHIASGYAAGYYGYLWSLVLAEDLRTAFTADRLDAQAGRRYRESVLENGGQVAPAELMQRFLGRPTDSRAFFNALER